MPNNEYWCDLKVKANKLNDSMDDNWDVAFPKSSYTHYTLPTNIRMYAANIVWFEVSK